MERLTGFSTTGGNRGRRMLQVWDALGAGALTSAELQATRRHHWAEVERLPEEVLGELTAVEQQVFSQSLEPGERVLVVGSGTGRELLALARRGHEAVGVEPSSAAAVHARALFTRHRMRATVIEGFIDGVELPGTFDAIVFSHRYYGGIQGSVNRIAALRKCRMALNQDGRVIASYAAGTGMHAALRALARVSAIVHGSGLRPERGDQFYRPPHGRGFGFEHFFAPGEFEAEAQMAGLHVEASAEYVCPLALLTPQTRAPRTALRRFPAFQPV